MNFVKKHKIAFAAIPKTACSSLKHLFFQLENKFEFQTFRANGKAHNIHTFYPSRYFERGYKTSDFDEYFRFLIVRDPVKRFLSAYSNRVLHYNNLAKWELSPAALAAGATPNPDLPTFIEKLELYRTHSGHIQHHTDLVGDFTGPSLDWFDAVWPIERMGDCAQKLTEIVGRPIAIPHEQTGGKKFFVTDLTPAQLNKVVNFYREDYALLKDFYAPPTLPESSQP